MSINTNDKVKVVNPLLDFYGETGTVINTYNVTPDNVAIVRLDCGITTKIRIDSLDKIEAQVEQDPEIPEGARRITEGDFRSAVFEVTAPGAVPGGMNKENPMSSIVGAMVGNIVGMRIAENLFKDFDVVTLNEDQLATVIWNGCAPENVSHCVNDDMSIVQSMSVSLAAIVTLKNLVGYFFPKSLGNA